LGERVNQNIGSARISMALFHELTNSFTNMQLKDFTKTVDLTRAAFVTFNSQLLILSLQVSNLHLRITIYLSFSYIMTLIMP
jgi:hypothetical protein